MIGEVEGEVERLERMKVGSTGTRVSGQQIGRVRALGARK